MLSGHLNETDGPSATLSTDVGVTPSSPLQQQRSVSVLHPGHLADGRNGS
jgi:hypothetical protein